MGALMLHQPLFSLFLREAFYGGKVMAPQKSTMKREEVGQNSTSKLACVQAP